MNKKNNKKESKVTGVVKKSPKSLKTSKDYCQKGKKYLDFNHFWALFSFKNKLNPSWKESLEAHLKKIKCDSPDKYEVGLKHFLGK